jgi:hypothetical protein
MPALALPRCATPASLRHVAAAIADIRLQAVAGASASAAVRGVT